jgi:hypothetical protein
MSAEPTQPIETAAVPTEQATPNLTPYEAFTAQKTANPAKSAKEIRDELNLSATEIFRAALEKCNTEEEARAIIPKVAEELGCSTSLGRKAIDGIEKFKPKDNSTTEAKEGTFKEDAPPVSQRVTSQLGGDDQQVSDGCDISNSIPPNPDEQISQFKDGTYHRDDAEQLGFDKPPAATPEAIESMQNLLGVETLTGLWEEGTTALSQILNCPNLKKTRQTCERLAKIWQPVVISKAPSLAQKPEYVALGMTVLVFLPDVITELKALSQKKTKQVAA